MALVDFAQRELTITIVYFGAVGAGCGTNVRQLHRSQPPRSRVDLKRKGEADRGDRIWHFTVRCEEPLLPGWTVMMRVASIAGGRDVRIDRAEFLSVCDAVVFVADARATHMADNLEALADLQAQLADHGLELDGLPVLLQVNHTDAANARPSARVLEELDVNGGPHVEALARQGKGVLETFDQIRNMAVARLREALEPGVAAVPLLARTRHALQQDLDAAVLAATDAPEPPRRGLVAAHVEEVELATPVLRTDTPVRVMHAELRDGRLRVESLVRGVDGASKRLVVVLGAPDDTDVVHHHDDVVRTVAASRRPPPVAPPVPDDDLPPLTYGALGVLGGFVTGFLLRYAMFG